MIANAAIALQAWQRRQTVFAPTTGIGEGRQCPPWQHAALPNQPMVEGYLASGATSSR
jgi:hypothetical protein